VAALYSVLFAQIASLVGASLDLYTVPAGNVAVVRDISARNTNTTSDTLFVLDTLLPVTFATFAPASTTLVGQWQGREVFPAGHTLALASTGGIWQVRVSGYLLTMP